MAENEKNIYLKRLASFGSNVDYKFNCISLFSGGGGLDLGAHFAGFKSLLVSDIIPVYTKTIKENLKKLQGRQCDRRNIPSTGSSFHFHNDPGTYASPSD